MNLIATGPRCAVPGALFGPLTWGVPFEVFALNVMACLLAAGLELSAPDDLAVADHVLPGRQCAIQQRWGSAFAVLDTTLLHGPAGADGVHRAHHAGKLLSQRARSGREVSEQAESLIPWREVQHLLRDRLADDVLS